MTVAAYLAERVADGAAAATVRTIRAAIRAGHVDTGADDPTGHDGVRRVLQGLTRQAAGRGRGQADPLTADDVAASDPGDSRRASLKRFAKVADKLNATGHRTGGASPAGSGGHSRYCSRLFKLSINFSGVITTIPHRDNLSESLRIPLSQVTNLSLPAR